MGKLTFFSIALLMLVACAAPREEWVSEPALPAYTERGREIAQGVAACGFCHGAKAEPGSPLIGGRWTEDRYGKVYASNITPASQTGIGDWSVQQIVRAIRSGIGRNGETLSQEVHRGYEWMSDEDALSLATYLRSLPPLENEVARRSVGFFQRNTAGLFEGAREVKGYVPSINPRFNEAFGKYLTDNVARCAYCHSGESGIFGGEEYLSGRKTISNENGSKIAPPLAGGKAEGLGSWSEEDIIRYLKTGETLDGRPIDRNFCPVAFYKNADNRDLIAIAKYLKTVPE